MDPRQNSMSDATGVSQNDLFAGLYKPILCYSLKCLCVN